MGFDNIAPVAMAVLTNKYVIGIFIAVVVFLSFAAFVANYTKKPKAPKIQKPVPQAAPSAEEDSGSDGEDDGGDDE